MKACLLTLSLLCLHLPTFANYNRDSLEALVAQYIYSITFFSEHHENDSVTNEAATSFAYLFEDPVNAHHAYDLFRNENGNQLMGYIATLSSNYSSVKVDFDTLYDPIGTQVVDAIPYEIVTLDKTLSYPNFKPHMVTLVLVIKTSQFPYRIDGVFFPNEYLQIPGSLKIDFELDPESQIDNLYVQKIVSADDEFNIGNYVKAKDLFAQALACNPSDQYSILKISQCIDRISLKNMLEAAEEKSNAGDFFTARQYWTDVKNRDTSLSVYVNLKIAQCDSQERAYKYSSLISLANECFRQENYPQAKVFYQEALKVDIEKQELISKINFCNEREKSTKSGPQQSIFTRTNKVNNSLPSSRIPLTFKKYQINSSTSHVSISKKLFLVRNNVTSKPRSLFGYVKYSFQYERERISIPKNTVCDVIEYSEEKIIVMVGGNKNSYLEFRRKAPLYPYLLNSWKANKITKTNYGGFEYKVIKGKNSLLKPAT